MSEMVFCSPVTVLHTGLSVKQQQVNLNYTLVIGLPHFTAGVSEIYSFFIKSLKLLLQPSSFVLICQLGQENLVEFGSLMTPYMLFYLFRMRWDYFKVS